MSETEQGKVAAALGEAGAAHGAYEAKELKGVYDQVWPVWYAAYLIEHGLGELLGKAITKEQLTKLLAQYDNDYRAQQRQEGWPDYYAAQLLVWRDAASDQTTP